MAGQHVAQLVAQHEAQLVVVEEVDHAAVDDHERRSMPMAIALGWGSE